MSDTLSKVVKGLFVVLMVLAVVFGLMFYAGPIVPETIGSKYEEPVFTELLIKYSYVLFAVAVISADLFAIIGIISNPKAAVRSLLAVLALLIVCGIAYIIASPEIPKFAGYEEFNITPALSRNVGAGLIGVYILFAIAALSVVFTETAERFK